jgi:hypothetical protein
MSKYGKRGDVIAISWDDSCGLPGGWTTREDLMTFCEDAGHYKSIGYLLGVYKKRVVLVQSISVYKHAEQRTYGGFAIPIVAIRWWKKLG